VKWNTGIRDFKDRLAASWRELLPNPYRVNTVKFIASWSLMAQHNAWYFSLRTFLFRVPFLETSNAPSSFPSSLQHLFNRVHSKHNFLPRQISCLFFSRFSLTHGIAFSTFLLSVQATWWSFHIKSACASLQWLYNIPGGTYALHSKQWQCSVCDMLLAS